jgi:hypothetical protein
MRTKRAVLMLFLLAALPGTARATSGTCTISSFFTVIDNIAVGPFPVAVATGIAMPVEFDETTGAFSMKRDAWSDAFGATGADFLTVGIHSFIIMDPGTVTGTIDRDGNVTLPNFVSVFATAYQIPVPHYTIAPNLTTELQFATVGGTLYPHQGSKLNTTTGDITLEGVDVISAAVGTPGATLSGYRFSCRLDPIPNIANLPATAGSGHGSAAAPSLAHPKGKGRIGKPLPTTPPAKPDKGDVLILKTQIDAGGAALDFAGQDFFLRLGPVTLHVTKGNFKQSGKALRVVDKPADKSGTDSDGTIIEAIAGLKTNGAVSSALGGAISFTTGKKGTVLALKVQGLDLSALSGTATLTVAVGPYSASKDVTVRGSGKTRKFH